MAFPRRARGISAKAKAALLPSPDGRVPMSEIYEMFRALARGRAFAAAGVSRARILRASLPGFYFEALSQDRALEHIVGRRRSLRTLREYMHMVARACQGAAGR